MQKLTTQDLFGYLDAIFNSDIDAIDSYVNVPGNRKIKEEVHSMANMGASLAKGSYKEGWSKGCAEGKSATLFSLVVKGLISLQDAASEAGLSLAKFQKEMEDAGYAIH